jgi:long-chain acyl-CoA synthetase
MRGGNVMKGYYKDPEKTAETIDADGWLHTGDVAKIDEEGYVHIVDRKKELIITAGGKNISPANLEALLKEHPLVGQACAIGDRRPYVSALVVLDHEAAPVWAQKAGIAYSSLAELSRHPAVQAEIEMAVRSVNARVSQVEGIRRFTILPVEWTPESEELTPTMKLKRRVILDKYADKIEEMYTREERRPAVVIP